jgi:hypothetical protein
MKSPPDRIPRRIIDSYGGNQSFGVSLEILREDFKAGLEVLADVMLRPSFPSPN